MGRVDNDHNYIKTMQCLAAPEAQHSSPSYGNLEELRKYWPRQLDRRSRKGMGFPASADVAVLSRMLELLLDLPTSTTEVSLREYPVVISYPAIYGFYQEDVLDAAEYLGVQTLSGLCRNYQNKEACRQEGLEMPVREVLHVEYTVPALLQHASVMREAHDLASRDIDISAQYGLSSDGTYGDEGAAKITQAVLQFLQKKYKDREPPKDILAFVTGGNVHIEVVQAVAEAIRILGSEETVLVSGSECVTAQGAAELAWRSTERRYQREL